MNGKRTVFVTLAFGFLLLGWVLLSSAVANEAPRISKEELKAQLGSSDMVLLDVRRGKDWTSSELKIKGAIREDPEKFDTWATKYPKDKELVLYCA